MAAACGSPSRRATAMRLDGFVSLFPTVSLVFQHDTPDKHLFAHEVRAYSHGCMRMQDPAKYAEVLLNIARPREHWTAAKIKSMFGRGEQNIQLQPTPDLGPPDLSDGFCR